MHGGRHNPKRLKARAYAYAAGDGPPPSEIEASGLIERYGAQSVYGRPLWAHEITRMYAAEQIVNAYRARQASINHVVWALANPKLNKLLIQAEKLSNG